MNERFAYLLIHRRAETFVSKHDFRTYDKSTFLRYRVSTTRLNTRRSCFGSLISRLNGIHRTIAHLVLRTIVRK